MGRLFQNQCFDPSDLAPAGETLDKDLDRAFRKLQGLDKLILQGQQHLLVLGLSKQLSQDRLSTSGGAQATFIKSLSTPSVGFITSIHEASSLHFGLIWGLSFDSKLYVAYVLILGITYAMFAFTKLL